MSSPEEVPAALPSMWRALKRGYAAEPALLSVAFGLVLLAAVPDALLALWLKILADGIVDRHRGIVLLASLGLALSTVGSWFLRVMSDRIQRRFRDRVTIALESHVARLQASIATLEHQERRDHLDRLEVLRNQVYVLDHMYMSLFSTCGWVLRLGVTVALLASVDPVLALLAVFALPTVVSSMWRPGVERAVEESGSQAQRLSRHLFVTATTAAPGKEVRVTGIGDQLTRMRRETWERWYVPVSRARWVSAAWHTASWFCFGAAFVAGVVFVASRSSTSAGDVLLVLAAGSRLSAYVGAAVGELGFLRGVWMDGSQRLAWLEDYADSLVAAADREAPSVLRDGITVENVSFRYPGTDRLVLEDVSLHLPAGTVVAVVGENGAGKTTLVKLLCRFYAPTSGRILVDGEDLADITPESWRRRVAGAFQDFFRFELLVRQSVGVGDVDRICEDGAVDSAAARAGADDLVGALASGLETQLGPTWRDGVDLSHGQWQKVALARGFMRVEPLLLLLDEPTSALDAETEHALFERYAHEARAVDAGGVAAGGRITVLVSHRFSTLSMADLIVVLDGSRVVEVGSHEDLVAAGGQYAELYGIQAAAYQ